MTISFDNSGDITFVETDNHNLPAKGFDACFRTDHTETEYPVSTALYNHSHRAWGTPIPSNWDDVNDAVEEAYESDWTGLGAVENPDGTLLEAGASTDHHGNPRYGNGHLCELVRMESNARSIRHMLEEAGARFFGDDRRRPPGMFFYDMGHGPTVDFVVKIERGLSDYPLVDEMDHSMLEEVVRQKTFEDELPSLDSSIDADAVWTAWTDQDDNSYCPECGTGDSVEEILRAEGYAECEDCGDWFDPDHDETTSVQCTGCANSVDKARATVWKEFGFDPATGEGLIIRMYGDVYRLSGGKWVPHIAYRDEHILGE